MKKQYAVVGLGRFGGSICSKLSEQGQEVLAIDKNEERVSEYVNLVTHAVVADTTDEETVKSLGLRDFDHVIVAIGDDIQSSILTTLILKESGVKKVTSKAINDNHGKVLAKIGADRVIHPERESGERIAMSIVKSHVLDYVELSNQYSIIEVIAGEKMRGKSLMELDIRAKYGITILVVKSGDKINVSPPADQRLNAGDTLVVMGEVKDVQRFQNEMLDK